jgi:putative methanogenesis marker protein 8
MTSEKVKIFLNEIRKDFGFLPKDLHVTRKACALVAISDGNVIKMEEPKVCHCPLFTALFSYKDIDKCTIQKKFERQSDQWGMFTCNRKVCDEKIIVPFGASEMIMYTLKRGSMDAAVVVCEGAGTVITANPGVVQGIGAYMNGLFYTTPIPEVISNIIKNQGIILSPSDAKMDQLAGVKKALDIGYSRIAVTVRGDEHETITAIRRLEKEIKDSIKKEFKDRIIIVILAICNTGISEKQAKIISDEADLAWACASNFVREIVGPKSILQVGMKIPVFVLTDRGLDFISSYSSDNFLKEKLIDVGKKHYITLNKFEKGALKINMGRFSVFLYETKSLPIKTEDEPYPLI